MLRKGAAKFYTNAATAAASTHRGKKKPSPPGIVTVRPKPKRKKATWARKALFPFYEVAAQAVGFQSAKALVRQLQGKDVTGQFADLDPDTLRKWIEPNDNGILGWSAAFLARVERDGANIRAGRKKFVVSAHGLGPFTVN